MHGSGTEYAYQALVRGDRQLSSVPLQDCCQARNQLLVDDFVSLRIQCQARGGRHPRQEIQTTVTGLRARGAPVAVGYRRDQRVLAQDGRLQLTELRRRVQNPARPAARCENAGRPRALRVCRPSRSRASISWPRGRSRSGCSLTSRPSSAARTFAKPRAKSASTSLLQACQVQFLQPHDLGLCKRFVAEVGQRRTLPQQQSACRSVRLPLARPAAVRASRPSETSCSNWLTSSSSGKIRNA